MKVLVHGYGNPGRLDDGLGPAFAAALSERGLGTAATLETGYQLQIEDAALVAEHDVVIFVDADASCPAPFRLRPLEPGEEAAFSTHALSPGAVLGLARRHFGAGTRAFVLGIRGYEFDGYGERLSPQARYNLERAVEFVEHALRDSKLALASAAAAREGEVHAGG
jgi:hydrogenase maturation protease